MFTRKLREIILPTVAAGSPVVVITGSRQAGKATLARACFADRPYRSLEDPLERAAFHEDPRAWLAALASTGKRCHQTPAPLR